MTYVYYSITTLHPFGFNGFQTVTYYKSSDENPVVFQYLKQKQFIHTYALMLMKSTTFALISFVPQRYITDIRLQLLLLLLTFTITFLGLNRLFVCTQTNINHNP